MTFLPLFRRDELHLFRDVALGDVLMCTPALRRLRELNPDCRVTFYTNYPMLIEGIGLVDAVLPTTGPFPRQTIWLGYEGHTPLRRHAAKIIGDHLGFEVIDVRPSCALDPNLRHEYQTWFETLPHPWIVVNRSAGPHTPNKQWPHAYWDILVNRLLGWASIIEVGTGVPPRTGRDPARHVNLVGQLTIEELVAVIAAADLHVGPGSGPAHIAAAFEVPSVVIYGGYEERDCFNYEENIDLYSPLTCSPCWLRTPCPHGLFCLRRITPTAVESALIRLWNAKHASRTTRNPPLPAGAALSLV